MRMKVAKFGGSSVADALQIEKIRNIIQGDPDIRYVVVSAPGKRFADDSKVTDLLYLCKTHIEHKIPYEQIFQVIYDRFMAVEADLGVDVDIKKELKEIKQEIEEGVSVDYIASRGEYLNAKIVAAYLGYDFVDAKELIKFNEKGKLMDDLTNEKISKVLSEHEYAVIPGFYGERLGDGKVKTFTRGGSDITGALIARATNAEVYENWTDVSGFLMADPRIVKNPKPIKSISYIELRELSYMGASVLHEDAIFPAKIAGIPINIRNTNSPEDSGTMITAHPKASENQVISGVAGRKNFTVIGIYKNHLANEKGFIRRLAGIIEDHDMTIEHLPTGIDTMSVVIDNKNLNGKLDELVEEFERQLKPDSLDVVEDMALIATVGAGMASRKGTSAKLFAALADIGVNIRMIDQGSSEMNIIVGVENKDFERSVKAIYEAFVE
ncbi:MAG: aspartate kinase [Firmicutes bacterium]|nr:aspartate kinase [Bacillota bacterium]